MDSCTVDVTDLVVTPPLSRQSVFTLVGADAGSTATIEDLALAAGTIPQELLVGFDDRLPMVFGD
jgi:alanine racemase